MQFLNHPTRNLFFTGKGGVGKTSMACASAVQLADRGLRVLLVSTDPASNLDEVLGTELASEPTPVGSVPNLFAMNLDPEAAASEYRERMVGPYRGVLPDAAVASMEEQFSGSCTLEIAAFDEFAKLLGDREATSQFDHVVFDTAPTGHTLRLLTLPSAWSGYIDNNTTGTSCLGPLAGLQSQTLIYKQTVEALADGACTTLVLVTRPEPSAFREASRTSSELQELGVRNQHMIVNGVFTSQTPTDEIAVAMQRRGDEAIAAMPGVLATLNRSTVPLASGGVMGVEALRRVGQSDTEQPTSTLPAPVLSNSPDGLGSLIDELATVGHGVILAMGKGGVGKTTVAAAVAVALAERGLEVHLSTTDPAAHVSATIAADELAGLTVGRIDPAQETADYTAEVLQTAGKDLDAEGKALLEEDLRSPCTEEIAVFRAFAKAVSEGADRFVVLDTAPTGHTILLLDSALAYHREVTRQSSQMPESVEQLLPRLRDPDFTRVLVVTLPEATPVHEAARLQQDLRRAEIEPFAWVINQSLVPLSVTDPALRQRQHNELPYIDEVRSTLANRVALVPWQSEPPTGLSGLRRIVAADSSVTG
ncbi:arsenical pump-driving ATPase [Allorhodopirellula heiligendammensis]|uniref:arsenite-transporting ATPase n=1 Tax=Allorhodopirellula heiligendammensis TaxID=2714739 RepID=A0A5C6C0M4_9BACT|nr:arsenical pump-driving ATPase [Allorhodopirellula heiligendammensis]TWU17066.1 Arsenical pump-driving ATPase [Allorhodopirellula heiligendammensis]